MEEAVDVVDKERCIGTVDDELWCGICAGLLRSPLLHASCERHFCSLCITKWLDDKEYWKYKGVPFCPICKAPVTAAQLQQAQRAVRNMVAKVNVRCKYECNGCSYVNVMESLGAHERDCGSKDGERKQANTTQPAANIYTISVKDLEDRTIVLPVAPTASVEQVKEMIHSWNGMPPDQQRLMFLGHQLQDGRMMSSYAGFKDRCTINLLSRMRGGGELLTQWN